MTMSINRQKGALPKSNRATVPPHAIFQDLDKAAKATGTKFANLGYVDSLGKYFSIALDGKKEGKLCGSEKVTKKVAIGGTFEFEVDFFKPKDCKPTTRGALEPGDVFQVPGSAEAKDGQRPAIYINLGKVDRDTKVLSYNLNTKNLATGSKMTGTVKKVGNVHIATKLAA